LERAEAQSAVIEAWILICGGIPIFAYCERGKYKRSKDHVFANCKGAKDQGSKDLLDYTCELSLVIICRGLCLGVAALPRQGDWQSRMGPRLLLFRKRFGLLKYFPYFDYNPLLQGADLAKHYPREVSLTVDGADAVLYPQLHDPGPVSLRHDSPQNFTSQC
jgi:hypothetical protein